MLNREKESLQAQAVRRELPRKANMVARYLEGDENNDRTYEKFTPDNLAEELEQKLFGFEDGDITDVANLYKDEKTALEIGAGTHIIQNGYRRNVTQQTRVYKGGELVLHTGGISRPQRKDSNPDLVREYHPGSWEHELDQLIKDAERAYEEEVKAQNNQKFGRL